MNDGSFNGLIDAAFGVVLPLSLYGDMLLLMSSGVFIESPPTSRSGEVGGVINAGNELVLIEQEVSKL